MIRLFCLPYTITPSPSLSLSHTHTYTRAIAYIRSFNFNCEGTTLIRTTRHPCCKWRQARQSPRSQQATDKHRCGASAAGLHVGVGLRVGLRVGVGRCVCPRRASAGVGVLVCADVPVLVYQR